MGSSLTVIPKDTSLRINTSDDVWLTECAGVCFSGKDQLHSQLNDSSERKLVRYQAAAKSDERLQTFAVR